MSLRRIFRSPIPYIILGAIALWVGFGLVTGSGFQQITTQQGLQYLKNGQMYATIDQHPDLMGKYGVRMAIGVLDKTVPKGKEFLVPLELVTKQQAH